MHLTVAGREAFAATGGRDFDPALPCAVLVHGAGMDHTVWALQARALAHRGRSVLAVDLPGHGRSAGPALDSIEAIAAWLVALLGAAGVARAALVGHSMGSLAALAAAAAAPERVERIALLGSALRIGVHPALLSAARADDPAAAEMITGWGFGARAQLGGHSGPGLWMTGAGRRLLRAAPPGVLATDLAACEAYGDVTPAAAKVACPALLLVGAADRMTPPKAAAALAGAIPDARTVVLPEAGHMMMVERPDATLDALLAFLDERRP